MALPDADPGLLAARARRRRGRAPLRRGVPGGAPRAAETSLGYGIDAATTSDARARLEARYEREKASARAYLLAEDVDVAQRPRALRIRAAIVFIESYRELPLLAWPREVIDGIVALEQSFVIFRQRHARMVERVIGRRTGTGGSAGVEYLDQTALRYRIFREVWAARTLLIRRAELPAVERAEVYDFAGARGRLLAVATGLSRRRPGALDGSLV